MLINDVLNKEELSSLVIGELKELGVKYRREKKQKVGQEKCIKKRIFRTHLHLLELTDVVLANGGIVQIPQFVADACQRILEQVGTEGLFRKAGSSLRQREIKLSLEAGLQLGRAHHVIDVANVLKSFFRELPEPLLPSGIQEALLRSLLISEGRVKAILMACLLLPPLTINTLAFFMQFLYTVSLSAEENKMSIENLAIIFTPGLMPFTDITGIRFNNHVKVVQILIENAEMIGVLPESIIEKLHHSSLAPSKSIMDFDKKKKKRRSGSLTRMFNGLKKIVGAIGSSEDLENTPDNTHATPCLTKSAKKRKIAETTSAFSAKKKKDILRMLPDNVGVLPNTPVCPNSKETKKRLSLGGRRNLKNCTNVPQGTSMERRWSVVGSAWSRKKQQHETTKTENVKHLSPVISMPCIIDPERNLSSCSELCLKDDECDKNSDSDYVRIPKSEYEAIKERVSAIETRISQELGNVRDSILHASISDNDMDSSLSGPERVLNKFERTMEETENMTSPSTEQLAKRLSRELKIRRSGDNHVIRSPSARKIGTIRRRSKENIRLSRNRTWHISSSKSGEKPDHFVSAMSIYPKSNLKRGRPNTLQTGLPQPSSTAKEEILQDIPNIPIIPNSGDAWTPGELFFNDKPKHEVSNSCADKSCEIIAPTKVLVCAEESATPRLEEESNTVIEIKSCTPTFVTKIAVNETKTPMLPPSAKPKRAVGSKTPGSVLQQDKKAYPNISKTLFTPTEENQNGRASIARLRTQNAGMVLAKAKLFDGLTSEPEISNNAPSAATRRMSSRFTAIRMKQNHFDKDKNSIESNSARMRTDSSIQRTPKRRNPPKSPGCIQKRQKFSYAKYSNRNLLESIVNEDTVISKTGKPKATAHRSVSSPCRNTTAKMKTKFNSPRRNSRTRVHSVISSKKYLNSPTL